MLEWMRLRVWSVMSQTQGSRSPVTSTPMPGEVAALQSHFDKTVVEQYCAAWGPNEPVWIPAVQRARRA